MPAHDVLKSNKTTIELILSANRQLILRKCYEKNMITKRDYMNLKDINKGTVEDHVIELVDNIMGKGEKRCEDFLDLLQNDAEIQETFPELNDILSKYTANLPKPAQESSSSANTDDEAQKNRKRKPEMDSSNNKKSKQDDDDDDDDGDDDEDEDEDEPYPLKSKPTGLCFIINNMNFKNHAPRYGSDSDAVNLAKVFSWLDFRVLMCEDQTKDQMDQALKCLSTSDVSKLVDVKEWSEGRFTDLQDVPTHGDAFVCCILTHGNMGVVCGTDGEHLAIKEIKKMFKATDRSPLTNKPKVFLIQACQGGQPHGRVVLPNLESDDSIPEETDFLIGMSTVEDYESYRHPVSGAWYIQTVCKKLKKGCPRGVDMCTILGRVNKEMSKKEGKMSQRPGVILKQMPELHSTLTMKLVFKPRPN